MAATAQAAPAIDDGTVTAEQVLAIPQLDATDAPETTGATVHTAVPALRLRVGDQVVAFEGREIHDAIVLAHMLDVMGAKLGAGITAVDATHFTITAAMRDQLFADPVPTLHSARVVPAVKDGKLRGVKLYAIHPSSLPAQLGIRNGDLLLTVNGVELTADNLPATLAALANATTATVTLERQGQPVTLTCTVK